jgi:hypothetical protein
VALAIKPPGAAVEAVVVVDDVVLSEPAAAVEVAAIVDMTSARRLSNANR